MSEKVVELAGEAKAVSEYIAACHESWRAYFESKATGGEVDPAVRSALSRPAPLGPLVPTPQ